MDDNQNEWGDEETLDTKKFRVSPLPCSLPVLQAVSPGLVTQGAEGPSGPLLAPLSSFANLPVTNTHLGASQSFSGWSSAWGAFLGAQSLLFPSVRGAGDAAGHG